MELLHVYKSYGGRPVLEDVCLRLPDGAATVLRGASGRGKTTLLRLLMGLEQPDSGALLGLPPRFSAVFQEDRLPLDFTPLRCVRMTAPRGLGRDEAARHLAELGLEAQLDAPVRALSGGMRRRVALARAVLAPGEALYLDEPFTGLDAGTKARAAAYLLRHAAGRTLVVASHAAEDAALLGGALVRL